jgi:hypothetical protein
LVWLAGFTGALLFPVGPAAVAVGLALLGDQVLYQLVGRLNELVVGLCHGLHGLDEFVHAFLLFLSDYLYG